MADEGASSTAAESGPEVTTLKAEVAAPATPKQSGYPPYAPYSMTPAPPSVADTIHVGHEMRVKHKSMPRRPAKPPPRPARPRGPKATDVKMSRRAMRAHALCLRRHGAILTDRLEALSKPPRRTVIYFWREHADKLSPYTVARLRNMLDADEPFKPDQAYEYFINLRKTKKKIDRTRGVNQIKKDLLTVCADKRFVWARNATVSFARGIQQRLATPGQYALTDSMLRLSNIVMGEICTYMKAKPPTRTCCNPKARFLREMADKIAVWIDDVLAESDDRMLMMDFDEDEEVLGADAEALVGFADDFLAMMGGDGRRGGGRGGRGGGRGGRKGDGKPAYTKFKGEMADAFRILTNSMEKKGDERLIQHEKFSQSYGEAAKELKETEDFDTRELNLKLANEINGKLSNIVKDVTPPNIGTHMKEMVNICSNYLAQYADDSRHRGPAFKLLVAKMRSKSGDPLASHGPKAKMTMGQGATELENARSLNSDHDDPNLSQDIHAKLTNALGDSTPHEHKQDMGDTLHHASKYLSQRAVDQAERGPAFDFLIEELEKDGARDFLPEHKAITDNFAVAHALKTAPGLTATEPDAATAKKISEGLHRVADKDVPANMKDDMKDVIHRCGNYLSQYIMKRDKALKIIVDAMRTKPNDILAARDNYNLTYGTAATEVEGTPHLAPSFKPVKDISEEINDKLKDDVKSKTPKGMEQAMKSAVKDAADHLSQDVALKSGAAGDKYGMDLLTAVKESIGPRQLYKQKNYGQTYEGAAEELRQAKGMLETSQAQSALVLKDAIKDELHRGVPTRLTPHMKEGLHGAIDDASHHLAKKGHGKGNALEHIIEGMKKKGDERLGTLQGEEQTHGQGAKRIEVAHHLNTDPEGVDKKGYTEVKQKLNTIAAKDAPPEIANVMPEVVEEASKFLASKDKDWSKVHEGYSSSKGGASGDGYGIAGAGRGGDGTAATVTPGPYGTGPDGKPLNGPDGKPLYDPDGKPLYGPDGKPLYGPDGKPLYGPDGKPLYGPDGKPLYGPDGKPLYGPDGKPLYGPDGKPLYGPDGKPLYGPDGKPLYGPDGKPLYGPDGKPLYGPDGKPLYGPDGKPLYGPDGKPLYGPDGKPLYGPDGKPLYGPDGKPLYGPDGKPLYGPDGKPLYGPDGKPLYGPDGKPLYGPDGKPLYGPDGKPLYGPDGQPLYGPDGKPLYGPDGVAIGSGSARGKLAAGERWSVDEEGRPRRRRDGAGAAENDPDRMQAQNILHQQLKARGEEVFYQQPKTTLTHSQAADWIKEAARADQATREAAETGRLANKFERKLGNVVHKHTPDNLKEPMQDVIIEDAQKLSERFVAQNYKVLARENLISEMQKKGNEIMVEIDGAAETFFFAAQRLKLTPDLTSKEPCNKVSYQIMKALEGMIRCRSMPRKLGGAMKEHVKDTSNYLSEHVTKPNERIEAYVALLHEMEVAGDQNLVEGQIQKSYKDSAAYLKQLTSFEDHIRRGDSNLQSSIEKKLTTLMANVPATGYSSADMTNAITESTRLLVSYIVLQGERTEALKVLIAEMQKQEDTMLLRHGPVRKSYRDGADLLEGKNTDQLAVDNADPVVTRKIQIKIQSLMCNKTPSNFSAIMEGVIDDATMYLAVNLLRPQIIRVCKCMKNVFVQCELWCDEILRRVARPCCTCSRHVSAQALADLAPDQRLHVVPGARAFARGVEINVTPCASKSRNFREPSDRPCQASKPTRGCQQITSYLLYTQEYDRYSHDTRSLLSSPPVFTGDDPSPGVSPSTNSRAGPDLSPSAASFSRKESSHGPSFGTRSFLKEFLSESPCTNRSDESLYDTPPNSIQCSECSDDRPTCQKVSSPDNILNLDPLRSEDVVSKDSTDVKFDENQQPTTTSKALRGLCETAMLRTPTYNTRAPIITTNEMSDWHAMMVSLMWNVQAWREWIQENIDKALAYKVSPQSGDETEKWMTFQRRVTTEAMQWRQYNNFSKSLSMRLATRYSNTQIMSPARTEFITNTYRECQRETIKIIEMFNRWTHWLMAVVKETNYQKPMSERFGQSDEMHWGHFKSKVQEHADDWVRYNTHLKICWERKYKSVILEWVPPEQRHGPVWVVSACGAVPSGAVAAGVYENEVTWVARTTHKSSVWPAALIPSKHCCVVYANGGVHQYTKYQVMCNATVSWVAWRAGDVGARAVRVADGIYVGRVLYKGSHLLGPVRSPNHRCHVVIFGRQFAFNCYELLVLADTADKAE